MLFCVAAGGGLYIFFADNVVEWAWVTISGCDIRHNIVMSGTLLFSYSPQECCVLLLNYRCVCLRLCLFADISGGSIVDATFVDASGTVPLDTLNNFCKLAVFGCDRASVFGRSSAFPRVRRDAAVYVRAWC